TGGETTFQLSPILSPLAPYRSKLLITYGLQYSAGLAYNGDGHAQGMQVALTGRLNNDPVNNGLASGISVDQEVANKVGLATRFKSYPFGVRTNEFGGAWRYTSFYGSNSPVQPKNNPYEAFTQLFGGTQNAEQTALSRRRSILDALLGDYQSLRLKLGRDDRAKVDNHLTSIREIERKLAQQPPAPPATCRTPAAVPDVAGWFDQAENFATVGQLQTNMLVSALACDLTRVATLQWGCAASNTPLTALGIASSDSFHDPTHTVAATNTLYTEYNTWFARRFAELLAALDAVPEGAGTLLDNTVVLWFSEDSGNHRRTQICTTMAGSCGGYFRTGRFLNLDAVRPSYNDLLLSICHAMGHPVSTFGDPAFCKGPLAVLR
ncbi:MAG TPA: DUF1552 domain-containing protein, partial [Bdellovibrionales bacterium]|nr:DUF1552 domain-containing protein [Bdellovibrionales bacterium]